MNLILLFLGILKREQYLCDCKLSIKYILFINFFLINDETHMNRYGPKLL